MLLNEDELRDIPLAVVLNDRELIKDESKDHNQTIAEYIVLLQLENLPPRVKWRAYALDVVTPVDPAVTGR